MTNASSFVPVDFSQVTELPNHQATVEQLSMMYTRYRFAADFVVDKDVLELACGAGIGLGYLARTARSVRGVDIDQRNLTMAARQYASNIKVAFELADAHALPCANGSYDVVVLFDSIYFMRDPYLVLQEAVRVLRGGGCLLVSTVNRRWSGFNPSAQGTLYLGGEELSDALGRLGCDVQGYGAFPTKESSWRGALISMLRHTAVKLRLIPTSVRSKEILKRLTLGRLRSIGAEVTDGMAPAATVTPLDRTGLASDSHKILYCVGRKRS